MYVIPATGAPIKVAIPLNIFRKPKEFDNFSKPRNSTSIIAHSDTYAAEKKKGPVHTWGCYGIYGCGY